MRVENEDQRSEGDHARGDIIKKIFKKQYYSPLFRLCCE
jgi:hypothetical protein